jgi:hypothetical protein
MERFKKLKMGVAALGLGLVGVLVSTAPASAGTIVGWPTNGYVAYRLTHAETVQVFNDPSAVNPMCESLWNYLQKINVLVPPVNIISCEATIIRCVGQTVKAHKQALDIAWQWTDPTFVCSPHA